MHRIGFARGGYRHSRGIGNFVVVARQHSTLVAAQQQQQTPLHHSLLATIKNNNDESDSQQDAILQKLEHDIALANHGKPLNVNSPKQVSMAIFGTIQSTSRQVLMEASQGKGVEYERQQTLAKLVLQHRSLSSKAKQQQRQSSTLVLNTNTDVIIQQEEVNKNGVVVETLQKETSSTVTLTTSTTSARNGVQGSYGQMVDALFDSRTSKIHHFWKDVLLQITKPSAQSMVLQLNSQQCPMGYDPSASPGIKTTPNTSSEAGKKGSLLHYVRLQKKKYSDCIILTRVGEFYETYGIDAILLVEVSLS